MTEEQDMDLDLVQEEYCYLTTTGRVSGHPHEIEIWFGLREHTLYLLSGGREESDWVKNLLKNPTVTVRIAQQVFAGTARIVRDGEEESSARQIVARKYREMDDERTLSKWAQTALPVAIDLKPREDK